MNEFLPWVQDLGLPISLLIFALITGAMGKWYFASYVADLKVQFSERLIDKNQQIERWQRLAETNGAIAAESLELVKRANSKLDKIVDELKKPSQAARG